MFTIKWWVSVSKQVSSFGYFIRRYNIFRRHFIIESRRFEAYSSLYGGVWGKAFNIDCIEIHIYLKASFSLSVKKGLMRLPLLHSA